MTGVTGDDELKLEGRRPTDQPIGCLMLFPSFCWCLRKQTHSLHTAYSSRYSRYILLRSLQPLYKTVSHLSHRRHQHKQTSGHRVRIQKEILQSSDCSQMKSRDTAVSSKHAVNQRSLSYLTQINNSDLDIVRKALAHVHHSQPHDIEPHDKNQFICMREVLPGGSSVLIEACLKQLLVLLNRSSEKFDEKHSDDLEGKSILSMIGDHSQFHQMNIRLPTYRIRPQIPSLIPSLLSRDLRRMDFVAHPNEEPSIRVRNHVVLFSVDPIRAIIMSSRIIILVPPGGMDQILKIVESYMEGEL